MEHSKINFQEKKWKERAAVLFRTLKDFPKTIGSATEAAEHMRKHGVCYRTCVVAKMRKEGWLLKSKFKKQHLLCLPKDFSIAHARMLLREAVMDDRRSRTKKEEEMNQQPILFKLTEEGQQRANAIKTLHSIFNTIIQNRIFPSSHDISLEEKIFNMPEFKEYVDRKLQKQAS